MRRWLKPLAFSLAFSLLLPLAQADGGGWERFGSEHGITVYKRNMKNSDIIALRGEGVVEASLVRVVSVLVDIHRGPEWIDSLAEAKTIRRISETEYVEWDHVKTPFILADRDFVFRAKLTLDQKSGKVRIDFHSVQDPLAPKTDYVRGEFEHGAFIMTPLSGGKSTHVVAEVLADPKGSIPAWMVNVFQKDWPLNTLLSLRSQAKKKDIVEPPELKRALLDGGFVKP